MTVSTAVIASARDCMDMRVHSTTNKTKQRCGAAPVHCMQPQEIAHSRTSTSAALPPMFHSTPLAMYLINCPSDPASTRLSFNQSQSSLPPLDLGEGDGHPISSVSVPIQAGTPSVAGPVTLPSMSVPAFNLTADHTKIIFNLACKG